MKRAAAAALLFTLLCTGKVADAQRETDRLVSPIKSTSDGDRSTILTAPPALKGKGLRSGSVTVTENKALQQASIVRLPAERLEVVLVIDTSSSMKGAPLASAKPRRVTSSAICRRTRADGGGVLRQHAGAGQSAGGEPRRGHPRELTRSRPLAQLRCTTRFASPPTSSRATRAAAGRSWCCQTDATRSDPPR